MKKYHRNLTKLLELLVTIEDIQISLKMLRRFLVIIKIPKFVNYTIHAGSLEPDHWILDKNIGGGRFLGEGVIL